MAAPLPPGRRSPPGRKAALAGAATNLVMAAGLGAIRAIGTSAGAYRAEGPLPTLAIVVAVGAPGVLALIGVAIDRPILFGAAAFACGPLVIVSIAAFPLVVPCGLLLVAFAQATSGQRLSLASALVVGGFPLPVLAGLWILVTETRQYTYTFPGGSEGGDYFTPAHAGLCITLVAADLVLVSVLVRLRAAPTRGARRRARV